jgi:SAM-dependent methyltransferase
MISKTSLNCPACSDSSTDPITTKLSSQLYHCNKCDFYFCNPLPQLDSESAGANSVLTEETFTTNTIASWESRKDLFAGVAQQRHQYFSRCLNRQKYRLLEIGCGIAGTAEEYTRLGVEYVGIDIDKRMVSAAQTRGVNVSQEDLFNLDMSSKFDVISFSQVLEHIREPQLFIERVSSLLSEDGIVVCDVPNHNSLAGSASKKILNANRFGGIELPHHAFAYTRKSLHQLFDRYFNVVEVLTVNPQHPTWGQATPPRITNKIYYFCSDIFKSQSLLVAISRKIERQK